MTEQNSDNKNIVVSTKNRASIKRTQYLEDRNITTYMKCEYRRTSPGRVGVACFIEAEINGQRFHGGKNDNVESDRVKGIRKSLDLLGRNFNDMNLENATDATFDDLAKEIFSKVERQDEE